MIHPALTVSSKTDGRPAVGWSFFEADWTPMRNGSALISSDEGRVPMWNESHRERVGATEYGPQDQPVNLQHQEEATPNASARHHGQR